MAAAVVTGALQGKTITLDALVPALDGQRVCVIIERADEEAQLSGDAHARVWAEWVKRGPQGPIDDDEEPEFP